MTRSFDPAAARATPPVAYLPDRACADVETEIFFPTVGGHARKAKEICGHCPHRAACLEWALETQQSFGVWGGLSADERYELTPERRQVA